MNINTVNPLTGELMDAKLLMFADAVIKAKNEQGPWEVLDLIVKHWKESNPTKYKAFIVHVEDTKKSRANIYGSNKAGTFRQTLDIPEEVLTRFRTIYKSDEFPFDKEFYRKLWKRYQTFRVSERS